MPFRYQWHWSIAACHFACLKDGLVRADSKQFSVTLPVDFVCVPPLLMLPG
jgi:hypothetical protein